MQHRLKVGKINYTNILPIYYFLETRLLDEIDLIPQYPAELNKNMHEGTIDVGPMSSFAYAADHASLYVLPELSVSATGSVRSIYCFSKRPLEAVDEPRVALTNTSATSVVLLKILLETFMGLRPTYTTMPPDRDAMLKEHDACLLIGDHALKAAWDSSDEAYRYDLGELWYRYTGLPMTFAVWGVRKEIVEREPAAVAEVQRAFVRSKRIGCGEGLTEVIDDTQSRFGGSTSFWHAYFSGLEYDLSERHLKGLHYYYACAYELGYLNYPVEVTFWDPQNQSKESF